MPVRLREARCNFEQAALIGIIAANVLLGTGLVALGAHLLSTSIHEFSSTTPSIWLIIFGLFAASVSNLATTGAVLSSWTHMQIVGITGVIVVFGEGLLILVAAQAPISAQSWLRDSWKRAYNTNPLSLQQIEHMYGCCGFLDSKDMPSHPNCSAQLKPDHVGGCLKYLTDAVYHQSSVSAKWAALAVVVQALSLIVGCYLIVRVFEDHVPWTAEPDAHGDAPQSGVQPPAPHTFACPASYHPIIPGSTFAVSPGMAIPLGPPQDISFFPVPNVSVTPAPKVSATPAPTSSANPAHNADATAPDTDAAALDEAVVVEAVLVAVSDAQPNH